MSKLDCGHVVWIKGDGVGERPFQINQVFDKSVQEIFMTEYFAKEFKSINLDYFLIFADKTLSDLAPLIEKIGRMRPESKSKLYVVTQDGLVHFLGGFPQKNVGISNGEKEEIFVLVAEKRLRLPAWNKEATIETSRREFRKFLLSQNDDGSKGSWRLPWWGR